MQVWIHNSFLISCGTELFVLIKSQDGVRHIVMLNIQIT